ncbi:MAG: rhodanese-like domain-containing protein [Tistlia sp.]|uniref:rhodanese-like domain-containing protein n=1 Tax=Tistlia sp. TaxID=3057121 RepID=UPI0034A2749D
MKTLKLALAALAVTLFASLPAHADAPVEIPGATTVDADGVIALFDQHPDLIVLDNRKEKDFSAGHIEGAERLVDTDVNADTLAAVLPSKDAPVLMYCNGLKCGRAANAVQSALGLGYSKVYYYAKGMEEWNAKGLPVAKD